MLLYDSDIIPFLRLSGLLVFVNGLLGGRSEDPRASFGAPEMTQLRDENE